MIVSTRLRQGGSSGFSLVEVLVVIAVTGVLVGTAIVNFQTYSTSARDLTARADYRNLKLGLAGVLAESDGPQRIVLRNQVGPRTLGAPLSGVVLSPDVRADIVYVSRNRRNRRPRTRTRITVYHLQGGTTYRYTELNGVVTEQQIER